MDDVPILNPLDFHPRFQHITENIFKRLDKRSLANCSEVGKTWKNVIDSKNLSWILIIEVPSIQKYENTYPHVAAKTGQLEVFEKMMERRVDLNIKGWCDLTAFHYACESGHKKNAEFLMQKSVDFDIDLNAKDNYGKTAFHLVCLGGLLDIAKMLVQKSVEFNVDLNAKDDYGKTAFHFVCQEGLLDIVEMLMHNSIEFNIDLNAEENCGKTAFHFVCQRFFKYC